MELLLNLLWLLLALPAFFVWHRQSGFWRDAGRRCRSRSFVLLGCLLALLFPVVSASDDLHPQSAEIEESAAFKRTVKQSAGIRVPAWTSTSGVVALSAQMSGLLPDIETFGVLVEHLPLPARQALASAIDYRGPPKL
jgi:hypothetical protein